MFLFCIIAVLGLVVLVDNLENFDEFAKYAKENDKTALEMFWILCMHYAAYAPSLVCQFMISALPVAAAVIVVTRSSLSREFTMLRASGISLQRAILPFLVLSLLVGSLFTFTRDLYVPMFLRKSFVMNNRLRPADTMPLKLAVTDGDSLHFVEMGNYDGSKGEAYNLRIEVRDKNAFLEGDKTYRAFRARKASLQPHVIVDNPDTLHLNQWKPEGNATILEQQRNQRIKRDWTIPLPTLITQAMLERQVLTDMVMDWGELLILQNSLEIQLEIQRRIGMIFVSFAMLIVALPLILRSTATGKAPSYISNAIIAVSTCLVYYLLSSIFMSFGEAEVLPVFLAVHGSTILYTIVGIYLLRRIED